MTMENNTIPLEIHTLRNFLDELYDRFNSLGLYYRTSILGPVKDYEHKNLTDKECWTLFCAVCDFQVPVITHLRPMLYGLIDYMSELGIHFIDLIIDPSLATEILANFSWRGRDKIGFTHRFLDIRPIGNKTNILCLFMRIKELLEVYDSLSSLVSELYEKAIELGIQEPLEYVIKKFATILRQGSCPGLCSKLTKSRNTCARYHNLIPDPQKNSAMKRLCLFFRWMVRPHPDLGLWSHIINKRDLLVSLDSGIARVISRAFKLKLSNMLTWTDVIKVTRFLRRINPEDPAKYDFVLSRPSIMGYCAKDPFRNKCYLCPLLEICKSAHGLPEPKAKPLSSEKERRIFEIFRLRQQHMFDRIYTEYEIGGRKIDVVAHEKNCNYWVIEVESGKLNYVAIGQAIAYAWLFKKYKGVEPNVAIICTEAPKDLKEACEIDRGIRVFEIQV